VNVRREYDPSIPELQLDPDRVTQIFINLARNAVQAMEGEGQLTVRTRVETVYHLSPGGSKPVRMVRIEVEDTGPGVDDADLPHVFTPFYTGREDGTGLGLALTQHWVVKHGGRVQMLHAHAGGALVRVHLPIREAT
jgi:two-component system nitrogen regulation sensor histidine kinase GlnL